MSSIENHWHNSLKQCHTWVAMLAHYANAKAWGYHAHPSYCQSLWKLSKVQLELEHVPWPRWQLDPSKGCEAYCVSLPLDWVYLFWTQCLNFCFNLIPNRWDYMLSALGILKALTSNRVSATSCDQLAVSFPWWCQRKRSWSLVADSNL